MRQRPSVRSSSVAAAFVVGTLIFVVAVHRHAPIETWLVFRYALCWVLVAFFAAACTAVGHAIVRVLAPARPLLEHLSLSFAAGVLAFATFVFLGGIARLLGGVFFFIAPLSMIALAGPRALRDLWPEVRAAWQRVKEVPRVPTLTLAILAFGVLGVLLVYLPILAPENVSYDARWYHVAIAEHYAAEGAIRRFPEGLLAGTYPQTATMLYTWAFVSPLGGLFDRVELAAHVEFVVFLATLAGIPALVKRLVPSFGGPGSWAAFFLFPAIFVYDSELCCGADHVAALFAVPVFLALLLAWEEPGPRTYALLGVFVAGVLSVKYTAASVAIGPTLAITARSIQCSLRGGSGSSNRLRPWLGLATFAATCALLLAPYWLKNWVFYGDPVYPMLAEHFHPQPWGPDAAEWRRSFGATQMSIPGTVQVKSLGDLLYVLATFSFDVHDFLHFHGRVPVFGSLFSVATLALPFLKGARRLIGVALATYAGLAFWAIFNAQDRYLQALLPWMAAVTASTLLLAWRTDLLTRVASGLAVGMQILWGADAYLLPSHAMTRKPPVGAAIDLLGGRYTSPVDRLTPFPPWPWIGQVVGPHARVLLHEGDLHLGIGVPTVLDTIPFRYGIDYGRAQSSQDVYEILKSMGVTHLLWQPMSQGSDSLAGDLAFLSFANRHAIPITKINPFALAAMPPTAPRDPPFGTVLIVVCTWTPYEAGVYELRDLSVVPTANDQASRYPLPRIRWNELGPSERSAAIAGAQFVILETGCGVVATDLPPGFSSIGQRGNEGIYLRQPPAGP